MSDEEPEDAERIIPLLWLLMFIPLVLERLPGSCTADQTVKTVNITSTHVPGGINITFSIIPKGASTGKCTNDSHDLEQFLLDKVRV
ncbi:hypothetical protein OS493_020500 [Desmophyllum pertusum]|uniref:Uncharacterized protein n=1 Tax=Desmophyllum pertusum TaxID=174260 RepID=A0A9W9YYY1_9CNID|nr:hypothetical protein OS493_020500 [Desmophyllum pertusum]